ncbi:MAG: histidine phosphatase family protein [Bacteroidales bacterium]|nr:histidine phosphatase family protein [Bacteroidales bacterium]
MKKLYIVRHAKSSWDSPDLDDFNRPLMEKGKKRTKRVIDFLLKQNVKPDLIIASAATRAVDTAKIIAWALKYKEEDIREESFIYHATSESLHDIFYDVPKEIESMMIVGHNPTFTSFANYFLDDKIDWLPTSAVVCIQFDVEKWEDADRMNAKLRFYIYPKQLKGD